MTNSDRRLNIRKIIKHFGGRTPLHRLLHKHGINVSIKTVEAWASRNSIPSNRLASLVDIGTKIGRPVILDDFFENGAAPTASKP